MNNKTFILVLIAILGVLGLTSCNNTNAQFDLSDQKTFWSGTVDDEFKTDRVIIIFKKTDTYPELKLRDFGFKNAKYLEYTNLNPPENMLTDVSYLQQYRQMAVIYLKIEGKDKVLEAVHQLSKLEFIKYVGPEMPHIGGDD